MRTMPAKYAFEPVIAGIWGNEDKNDENDVICYRAADFDYEHLKVNESAGVVRNIAPSEFVVKALRPGDILIEKSGGGEKTLVGRSVIFDSDKAAVCSNFVSVLRTKIRQSSRYWNYQLAALYSNRGTEPFIKQSTGIQNLDVKAYLSQRVPVRSFEEQERIADELDRELAEIDEFIANQQRLLELATEKFNTELHQLTHLAHVSSVPLKRLAQITLGKMITPSDKGGMELTPYIRAANIQPGGVFTYQSDSKKMWFSSDELTHLNLKKGDVLVVEGGAGFGRSAVLEENLPGWGFQNSINRVRVKPGLADPHFINFCIRAKLLSGELENLTNQSTIPHLTAEKLNLIQIPNIEVGQQTEFANEIFTLSHRNSILIDELKILISLLLELKQSKIISLLN